MSFGMTSVAINAAFNGGPCADPVKSMELIASQQAEIGVLKTKVTQLKDVEKELVEKTHLARVISEEKEKLQHLFQQAVIDITQTEAENEALEQHLESHAKELDQCKAKFADELQALTQVHLLDKKSFDSRMELVCFISFIIIKKNVSDTVVVALFSAFLNTGTYFFFFLNTCTIFAIIAHL
ncbi:hypothetical protein RFI_07626 [Reticulomyxa filosa]|uniref:Uncharacterized protein n=1 Tax=Reticulomyxa filosa TaxID=46433 RepID=X6NU24_RETFI|nr:hypothetical protein RFI_07626 [Reticulomyxa filosa]|eukprot:ETO29496.1 hypothetical protein RFI_07626 [Reticulomyxa filosa]